MIVILNRKYVSMWLPVILNESRITVDDAMCVNMTNTILRGIHSNGRPLSLLGVWELTNEVMKTTVKKKKKTPQAWITFISMYKENKGGVSFSMKGYFGQHKLSIKIKQLT